ncbi:GntR family transcriptional regulator [Pikeienuella piscinae]|uniref:GntR family transcriptional regulator n=1 Tax=Pikeienuella piscinae TaxID=2748098 RepID=A0A7L5C1K8_9RHOB|nr:GntR family transcriptional regulator [Pikeienuella piscinae]QIE57018.1 GntR family transcriptional regulator [Pikeienuella piscinae]
MKIAEADSNSGKPGKAPPVFDATIAPDRPAAAQMVAILHEAILRGDLAPGLRLSEQEIAAAMRLSRQPVREAFIRLAGDGLLEIRPQRGTFVTRISVREVIASRFVREAVEADLVRRAAEAADPALAADLDELLQLQKGAMDADPSRFMHLDESFHRRLAEAAGRAQVWNYIQMLKSQMDRVRFLVAADMPREALLAQHRRIIEAVVARDAEGAEQAMREHLRQISLDLPKMIAAHPHFFEHGEELEIG